MALFTKKMNKQKENVNLDARVKVLGSGCKKCIQLEENVKQAMEEKNIKEEVGHIYEMASIASYGVMSTPALVIDDKVVSSGKVLSAEEVAKLL